MKLFSKSHRGGFTLIELLVVIAIISLLSSVVLASVRDAREKAQARAFRTELMQFVNAMELYRTDNGDYPPDFSFSIASNGTVPTGNILSYQTLSVSLYPYINKIPVPYKGSVIYTRNSTNNVQGKCKTSANIGPYVIKVTSNVKGFEDWSIWQYWTSSWIDATEKCFQLN